jgi:RNA polymerase III subunit Rpc25.
VEEVCLGHILESNEEGIKVGLGEFFSVYFIPAYWMLRPSQYDKESGLWVWTPDYDYDDDDEGQQLAEEDGERVEQRYEMYIGAKIRFKVKGINFTQVTNTAKGLQATTTSTMSSLMPSFTSSMEGAASDLNSGDDKADNRPVRKRSSSFDLSYTNVPPCMHITASICEDGLGLVSWWTSQEAEGEEEELYEGEEQDGQFIE